MDTKTKNNILWNTIGSLVNAFTSLFFLISVTRINGVKIAGVFSFAFSLACFFQVIGTYCGRSYQVTENNKEVKDSDYINSRYITCALMMLVTILYVVFKSYTKFKIILIFILVSYKLVEAFAEVLYGILQRNDYLDSVGKSLLLKGIFGVAGLVIVDIITHNLVLASSTLILVNLLFILFYDLKNLKKCKIEKNSKFNLNIFRYGFYAFCYTFLTFYLINAPKLSIDNYLNSSKQAIFGVIAMPATFMALCSMFIVHPYLNKLTKLFNSNKLDEFNKLFRKLIYFLLIIGVFVLVAAYFLGIPVLELVYGVKLKKYLYSFLIIIVGSLFYSLSILYQNALTVFRKTGIQLVAYIIDSVATLFLSNFLTKNYNLFGASLSYLISMLLLAVMYIIIYIFENAKMKKGVK